MISHELSGIHCQSVRNISEIYTSLTGTSYCTAQSSGRRSLMNCPWLSSLKWFVFIQYM